MLCLSEKIPMNLTGTNVIFEAWKANVIMYESTKKPNTFLLHGSRQEDSVAACLRTAALVVRTDWSPGDAPCTPYACPVKPVDRAEFSGEPGTGFVHHRCG